MHIVEGLIDATQVLTMGNELVDFELAVLVVFNELTHLGAALDASKCTTLPYAAGNELECCWTLGVSSGCVFGDGHIKTENLRLVEIS